MRLCIIEITVVYCLFVMLEITVMIEITRTRLVLVAPPGRRPARRGARRLPVLEGLQYNK